jgi:hypothetical protein
MDMRELKALEIAARSRLTFENGTWMVPSQAMAGTRYRVTLGEPPTCECEDFQLRQGRCKHILAALLVQARDGKGEAPAIVADEVPKRTTYKQDWPAYHRAQSTEKRRVQMLLTELCRDLPDRERAGDRPGPRPHLTRDAIFSMCFKVYCGLSARRFSTDLLEAHEKGHITKPIPGLKVNSFFEDEFFTPILTALIGYSARPLRSVETSFAIDSSGFGTSRYERWYDSKYGVTRMKCLWVKTHVACGTKTNVVTAARILDKDSGDSPQFVPLVKDTRDHFEVGEVSADKAYASLENFEAVASQGAVPYIAFKANATGAVGGWFEKAFYFFQYHKEEYLKHYHQRSNVESTFSAIKRKFGDSVRAKSDTAMKNEVLCKLLCHNLTCLVQEQETLGITPVFWKDEGDAKEEGPKILRLPGRGA